MRSRAPLSAIDSDNRRLSHCIERRRSRALARSLALVWLVKVERRQNVAQSSGRRHFGNRRLRPHTRETKKATSKRRRRPLFFCSEATILARFAD